MKTNIKKTLTGLATLVSLAGLAVAGDCETVGAKVKKDIAKSPEKVLVIVDDAISKNESCACEVVKAAIEAADAEKNNVLVREIVVTAVSAAQGMAATIAECAVSVSPSSAPEIKAGLSEVFEGAKGGAKDVYYSSKGAKIVEHEEEETDDYGPAPVVISGVYLIAPVAPSAGGSLRLEELRRQQSKREQNLIELLRREQNRPRRPDDATTTRPTQS